MNASWTHVGRNNGSNDMDEDVYQKQSEKPDMLLVNSSLCMFVKSVWLLLVAVFFCLSSCLAV